MEHQTVQSLSELKQLQTAFYNAIFDPKNENITQASNYIIGTTEINEAERLSIYRDSILGGITTALTHIYPVCVKLVGEKYFTHMVAGYLKNIPSTSPDIGNYGEHLPAYIADFKPARELVYLADVAHLEWLWHKAFNAADDNLSRRGIQPLTALQNIAEQDLPAIKFCAVNSAFLIQSPYPIQRIWQVNQNDYQEAHSVHLDEGGISLVIWRSADFGMRIDELNEDETRFISAVLNSASFGDIAELEFTQALDVIVQRCIQTGLIIGFLDRTLK